MFLAALSWNLPPAQTSPASPRAPAPAPPVSRWRSSSSDQHRPVGAVNAPHLVALVRAGAVFKNGKLFERPDGSEGGDQQVAGHPDPQVLTIPRPWIGPLNAYSEPRRLIGRMGGKTAGGLSLPRGRPIWRINAALFGPPVDQ